MKGSRNVVLGETLKEVSLVPATWADVGKGSYDAAIGKVAISSSLAGQLPRAARFRQPLLTIGGSAFQCLKFTTGQQPVDFGFASLPSGHAAPPAV